MANNEEVASSSSLSPSSSSSHKTCVLACGYRQVFIPKSGNRFPAWLVQIVVPDDEQRHTDSSTAHTTGTATSATTAATTKTSVRSVWRSKRDFLRLSRSTSTSTSGRIVFPKRALTKLADAAPWKRPPDPIHTGRDNVESECALALSDYEGDDNWKVAMTKNLFWLDRFLQQTAEYCGNHKNSSDVQVAQVRSAWTEFCRSTDCEDLAVVAKSHDGAASTLLASSSAVEAIQRGNALGQYFCSKENADQLVECLLQAVKRTLSISYCSSASRKMLIVEPSCGHGTVIDSLRQQLQLHLDKSTNNAHGDADLLAGSKCQIIGLDIDEEAIAYCQKAVVEAKSFGQRKIAGSDNISISYHLTDFLATNETFTNRWTTADPMDTTTTTTAAMPPSGVPVFMVGGPPYSAGQGTSGDDWHGTLPIEFVEHSVHQWKAAAVAFLMPARCRNATYRLPADYRVETIDLEHSSQFYFQGGKKAVTQPSIIQVFWKAETDKETETGSS